VLLFIWVLLFVWAFRFARVDFFIRKGVKCVPTITIEDKDTGESWSYVDDNKGYAKAEERRQKIVAQGHRVGGGCNNSLQGIKGYYAGNGNLGRPGKPEDWLSLL